MHINQDYLFISICVLFDFIFRVHLAEIIYSTYVNWISLEKWLHMIVQMIQL